MANVITSFRIICSLLMLLTPVCSFWFYITYFLCGISDMIDGAVARKTNSIGEFGATYDTVADLAFVVAALIKLLPVVHIAVWLWLWIFVIATAKLYNIIFAYVNKRLVFLHTAMNKITGLILFLLPLTINFVDLKYSSVGVCFMGTISVIHESVAIRVKE